MAGKDVKDGSSRRLLAFPLLPAAVLTSVPSSRCVLSSGQAGRPPSTCKPHFPF